MLRESLFELKAVSEDWDWLIAARDPEELQNLLRSNFEVIKDNSIKLNEVA